MGTGRVSKAILVVSGHWEDADICSDVKSPFSRGLRILRLPKRVVSDPLSDFGSPELANRVRSLTQRAGLPTHFDPQRGFDHGTYSILAAKVQSDDIFLIATGGILDTENQNGEPLGNDICATRSQALASFGPTARLAEGKDGPGAIRKVQRLLRSCAHTEGNIS